MNSLFPSSYPYTMTSWFDRYPVHPFPEAFTERRFGILDRGDGQNRTRADCRAQEQQHDWQLLQHKQSRQKTADHQRPAPKVRLAMISPAKPLKQDKGNQKTDRLHSLAQDIPDDYQNPSMIPFANMAFMIWLIMSTICRFLSAAGLDNTFFFNSSGSWL